MQTGEFEETEQRDELRSEAIAAAAKNFWGELFALDLEMNALWKFENQFVAALAELITAHQQIEQDEI